LTFRPHFLSFVLLPLSFVLPIPPRPFLHPTVEKYRDQIADNYRKAIRAALGGA